MAVSVLAVELCDGRPAGGRSTPALSELPALAHWLGWLLALVTRAAIGGTDLDSAGTVFGVSPIARAAARPGARPTPGCGGGDRRERGPQADEWDLAESAQYLRHHLALVGRTDPLVADDAIARLHKASLGLPRALNNAAIAALIAAATAGKALVDDDCAKKAVAELSRD